MAGELDKWKTVIFVKNEEQKDLSNTDFNGWQSGSEKIFQHGNIWLKVLKKIKQRKNNSAFSTDFSSWLIIMEETCKLTMTKILLNIVICLKWNIRTL